MSKKVNISQKIISSPDVVIQGFLKEVSMAELVYLMKYEFSNDAKWYILKNMSEDIKETMEKGIQTINERNQYLMRYIDEAIIKIYQ